MYSRHHLSVKLSITLKELDEMLKHLGLRKKADAKRTTLTDEQKKFINDHFYKMTHKAISDQIR